MTFLWNSELLRMLQIQLDLWCAEVLTPSHHMLTRFSSSLKFVICQGQVRLLFFKIVWTKFTLIWARFGQVWIPLLISVAKLSVQTTFFAFYSLKMKECRHESDAIDFSFLRALSLTLLYVPILAKMVLWLLSLYR